MKSFSKYCEHRDQMQNEDWKKLWAMAKSVPSAFQKAFSSGYEQLKSSAKQNLSKLDLQNLKNAMDKSENQDFKILMNNVIKNYDKHIAKARELRAQKKSGQQTPAAPAAPAASARSQAAPAASARSQAAPAASARPQAAPAASARPQVKPKPKMAQKSSPLTDYDQVIQFHRGRISAK